jgi:hypothetical protein
VVSDVAQTRIVSIDALRRSAANLLRGEHMSTITIFDNEKATLWLHPDSGIVHHKSKTRDISSDDFRNVLNQGCDLMKKNSATKWLGDDRAHGALSPEDAAWAEDDWRPRVLAAGWKYWAIVLPQNVIGHMDMKHFIDDAAKDGVEVQVFWDPGQALAWLESV